MKEIHDWAPWFRELARAVLDAGEAGLITQARRVDWVGEPELLRNDDPGIDPFSFFYSLAQKSTKNQRSRVYPSVAKCFRLAPPPDPDNQDLYVFPTPTPQAPAVFNDRREFRPDLLWRLFRQAVEDEPQIDPELFRDVLEIKFVAIVKLTQTLFLINPDYFVPADALQRLTANRSMDLKRCGHAEYVSAMGKAKRTFPECRPYEINAFVWFQYMSGSPLITAESRYFQVSTRAYKGDRWPDFDQSCAVYTDASRPGGPAGSWSEETTDGDPLRGPYPLAEPKRGDVILVRAGFEGRAIGVVHSNDYAEPDGLNERSRVHVYWINKASASFGGAQTDQKAFARTQPGSSTYRAFATAAAYEPTFALLNGPDPPPLPDPGAYALEHARQDLFLSADEIESLVKLLERKKNLVLQGPPGTGKTYAAQRLAWLLAGERSTERIEAVQFHQSYGYEDFVRGYRPTDTGGFDLQDGPFLRFCARAREAPDRPHVLIIDEINRGSLSRIFGELLMLIEADKRDPAWAVRTAYARPDEPAFHVPANLHLVGTMNTADRSLALVDYALRRRFAFSTVEPAFGSQGFDRHLADGDVPEPMRRRIRTRLEALNRQIREHPQLGKGFQIGHSYFCRPPKGLADDDAWNGWYTDVVRYEIEPLLREYWFDDAERARNALAALRAAD